MTDVALPDRLLKAGDVARILQVSRSAVYRLMASDLPTVRFGGTVRVRPDDLAAYIERKTVSHEQIA